MINSQHNMSDNVITSSFLPNQDHYFLKIENEQKSFFFSLKKVWKFMYKLLGHKNNPHAPSLEMLTIRLLGEIRSFHIRLI